MSDAANMPNIAPIHSKSSITISLGRRLPGGGPANGGEKLEFA